VLCHDSRRYKIDEAGGDYPIPGLDEVIDDALRMARLIRKQCFCAGVSVNTSQMNDLERETYLSGLQNELGIPCVDPIATGMTPIASFLLKYAP
jgi:uncharacterized NAD-dependent epimerase/dehydratase family protein